MRHWLRPYQDFKKSVDIVAQNPVAWVKWQIYGFGRALYPHTGNNDFRKLTTTILFAVWTLLTLGYNPGIPDHMYVSITALVFLILGQQWELEKMRIGPFTADFKNEPPTAPDAQDDED